MYGWRSQAQAQLARPLSGSVPESRSEHARLDRLHHSLQCHPPHASLLQRRTPSKPVEVEDGFRALREAVLRDWGATRWRLTDGPALTVRSLRCSLLTAA